MPDRRAQVKAAMAIYLCSLRATEAALTPDRPAGGPWRSSASSSSWSFSTSRSSTSVARDLALSQSTLQWIIWVGSTFAIVGLAVTLLILRRSDVPAVPAS
jgi:hypothetical protein